MLGDHLGEQQKPQGIRSQEAASTSEAVFTMYPQCQRNKIKGFRRGHRVQLYLKTQKKIRTFLSVARAGLHRWPLEG